MVTEESAAAIPPAPASSAAAFSIPPIECSLSEPLPTAASPFPAVERRYYTRYFTPPPGPAPAATAEGDEAARGASPFASPDPQCVLLHSNRISLVAISPEHPIVRGDEAVVSVDFRASDGGVDRTLSNAARGKGKKGGQAVDERSILCRVECEGGHVYRIRSNVRGKLIEVNERLVDHPNLLRERPLSDGFVGVVLLKIPDGIDYIKNTLITEEEFERRRSEYRLSPVESKVPSSETKVPSSESDQ